MKRKELYFRLNLSKRDDKEKYRQQINKDWNKKNTTLKDFGSD